MAEWEWVETDDEDAAFLTDRFRRGPLGDMVAAETLRLLKAELDDLPRWRLLKRWLLVRVAKQVARDAQADLWRDENLTVA